MAVNIDVNAVYDGKGLSQFEKDAKRTEAQVNRELKQQIRDRQRLTRLSRSLERDITREQREQERALKRQIADRRRLNRLSRKLERDLEREGGARSSRNQAIAGGVAGAVIGGAVVAADLAKMTAEAQRLEQATDALGRRFGVTGDQIVRSIEEASSGTIGRMDAMRAANQAMLLGVVNSEEEFAELAQISISLGRAMGQDATKSLEDITVGLGRQSKLILDNLGIIVDTERAYRDYAAQLGKTADQLTDAEKKQAFINETLRAGREAAAELGNVSLDSAGKIERLAASWETFQLSAGGFALEVSEQTGALNAASAGLDQFSSDLDATSQAIAAANKAGFSFDTAAIERFIEAGEGLDVWDLQTESLIRQQQALKEGKGVFEAYLDGLGAYRDGLANAVNATIDLTTNDEALAQAVKEAENSTEALSNANRAATSTTYELGAATEEQIERTKELNEIRRDFARDLIDIDEQAAEETADTWQDFFDKQEDSWQDYQKRIAKARQDHAKDLQKIDKDLQSDIDKITRDEQREIAELRRRDEREEKAERKRRQIDALADERLFNFEIRQLAAEGDALAIQQAVERRAIEEEIAREKQQVEAEIEDEKMAADIDRVRTQADERRRELQAEAAAEREIEQERLAEIEAAEEESYFERYEQLRQYREDKLAEIEAGKEEAIAKLGEELAEAQDLTKSELQALTPVAGKLGEDAGKAFADGISRGFQNNARIEEMLAGVLVDTPGQEPTATARVINERSSGGGIPSFDGGGFVPGPLGAPRLIMAHGGEEVLTPEQQRGVAVNVPVTVNGLDEQSVMRIVGPHIQALIRDLEEAVGS